MSAEGQLFRRDHGRRIHRKQRDVDDRRRRRWWCRSWCGCRGRCRRRTVWGWCALGRWCTGNPGGRWPGGSCRARRARRRGLLGGRRQLLATDGSRGGRRGLRRRRRRRRGCGGGRGRQSGLANRGLTLCIRGAGPGLGAGEPRGTCASGEADQRETGHRERRGGDRPECGARKVSGHGVPLSSGQRGRRPFLHLHEPVQLMRGER